MHVRGAIVKAFSDPSTSVYVACCYITDLRLLQMPFVSHLPLRYHGLFMKRDIFTFVDVHLLVLSCVYLKIFMCFRCSDGDLLSNVVMCICLFANLLYLCTKQLILHLIRDTRVWWMVGTT